MSSRSSSQPIRESPHAAAPKRVLVCEDQALTALSLKVALESFGYEVAGTAQDGEEAVRLAREFRPDAILMDVNMPRLDGIRALARIMQERPVAVVMVTAYSDTELIQSALAAGASGYLVKPIRQEQLQPALVLALASFQNRFPHPTEATAHPDQYSVDEPVQERELLAQATQEVHRTRQRLETLQRQYAAEHEVATALAEACLTEAPTLPGLEIAARYEPASDFSLVGGDLVDFFEPSPGRIALVVADLCGHGPEAVAQLARAKYMLRAYALDGVTPAVVAARLNQALCNEPDEHCPFLTLFCGVMDLASAQLAYCNAGHPPPLLYDPAAEQLHQLWPTGGVVGVLAQMEFSDATVTLSPGCVLTLYTDGIIEARSEIEMFGLDRLETLLIREAHRSATAIADVILQEARHFAGGRLQDDAALVILKRS